jgi:uncharacterized protein (TIGR00369 family)
MSAVPDRPESFGVIPIETLRSMSGLDLLQGIAAGRLPQAPLAKTLDFRLVEALPGEVTFIGHPADPHYNPIGSVHGGYAATLLDSCMSCAVQTTMTTGMGYTTLEFRVHLVRAMTRDSGPVRAIGKVVHPGQRVATAEGRILDRDGRLVAHGTTTCFIFAL